MNAVRHALIVLVLLVGFAGCGGDQQDASPTEEATVEAASTEEQEFTSTDRELFESNAKYEFLDILINRGAEAPFVDDWSCTWIDETTADCSGTGYDVGEEMSKCGYALLPCGNWVAQVHAACGDAQGHDCQLEIDLKGTDR